MGFRFTVVAALLASLAVAGQDTGVLRVRVSLTDADGRPTPVARHALLVSDNPATDVPRVARTGADGTLEIRLAAGAYMVESDRAVMLDGVAYEWFQTVDVPANGVVLLDLTTANAEVADPPEPSASGTDPVFLFGKWRTAMVSLWSPTTRATGFVVDARGLVATHYEATRGAPPLAVQVSDTLKVTGVVLAADDTTGVAIVRVHADVTSGLPAVDLDCTSTTWPELVPDEEFVAIAAELGRPVDLRWGQVVAVPPRVVRTDMTLAFGGAGGPVFNGAGQVVGLTTTRSDADSRWFPAEIVRTRQVCETLAEARTALEAAPAPDATPLPVEPTRPFDAGGAVDTTERGGPDASPDVVSSDAFDVAFITPPAILQDRAKQGWTGGRRGRAPEVEARLGRLTDFGIWSDYFAPVPAVIVLRVTPRMSESFWKRVAREAARTQGAELPPMKQFTHSFDRLTLSCDAVPVTPIHPLVLEHQLSETQAIAEGLYVFHPDAFDGRCGEMRLQMHARATSEVGTPLVVPPAVVERIRRDFSGWRSTGPVARVFF